MHIRIASIARPFILFSTLVLTGCDLEALLADPKAVQKEADAKAIGGACRHGLRSIEDCYSMNEKASKAAIFAGWKDMDQYMRDNKIEGIEPKGLKPTPVAAPNAIAAADGMLTEPADKKESDPKAKDGAKDSGRETGKEGAKAKEKAKASEKG